jgi:F0F1-type ATP synthase assembly protein I
VPEESKPPRPQNESGVGWEILGTLLAGIAAWSGIGWLVDLWLHTRFGVLVGMLVGFAGSMYLIVHKYGNK